MKRPLLVLLVIAVYLAHQDFWFWRAAEPLVLGLPIGLFYHACYTAAAAALMWLLVRQAWPAELQEEAPQEPEDSRPPSTSRNCQ